MATYSIDVNVRNEDELKKLIDCDLLEDDHVSDAVNYLRPRMPTWVTIGHTDTLELFWFSSERRKILDSHLPLCITKLKES